ncbi:MAG TPA: GNAT family N-acetyltransferase, partial [Moraxellaceae bacterium]
HGPARCPRPRRKHLSRAMRITTLRDHPEWIARLAALHLPQWQAAHPGWTAVEWEQEFQRHLGLFPCTVLALDNSGELLGSASLVADDMNGATALTPWLANVLVLPAARGSGIGGKLITAIETTATVQGFRHLHLFTEDQQAFYQRRGWQLLQHRDFEGKDVSVMRKALQNEHSAKRF